MLKSYIQKFVACPYRLTAPWRRLPDFLIIGAQKSGTTSLFHYLMDHPDVAVNPWKRKEMYFFNRDYERGQNFYRHYFPLCWTKGLVGEGSTVYLHSQDVPGRVSDLLPSVKLIAILREPAARAISHYYHHVKRGRESRSIQEAFRPELIARWMDGQLEDSLTFRYLNNGHYIRHLRRWLSYFPAQQLFLIRAEDMFSEGQKVYRQVSDFLGLRKIEFNPTDIQNVGLNRGSESEIIDLLVPYYSDSVRELKDLDLCDFGWENYD